MSARPENEQISVALNLLQANGDDLRSNPASADADAELRASILAHGLLEPLVVRNREGVWHVVAGHRRYRALRALAEAGDLAADYAVGCTILDDDVDATEAALAENMVRVAMHPADQAITFARLADAGATVEDIAHRFGMNQRTVRKRLRLGKLEPSILEKFRSGEIREDVAAAYATTANHERQLAAWEKIETDRGGNHHTGSILHLLQDDLVRSDSPIAQFVGAKRYAEAGGDSESTLFADYSVLSNYDLLRKLAMEKLQRAADRVTGWKWVMGLKPEDEMWNVRQDFTQLYGQPAPLTDAERATIEAEQRFMAEHQEDGDALSPELEAEWEKISTAADEVRRVQAGRRHWTDEQKAGAGVLLYIGNGGTVERTEGLVRNGDPVPGRDDEPTNGAPRTDPITGREVAEKPKPRGYSQGLSESITELRNGVLRRAVRDHPEVAADLLNFNLLCSMRAGRDAHTAGAGFYPSLPLALRKEYRPLQAVKGAAAAVGEYLEDPKLDLGEWWDEKQPLGVLFERYRRLPVDEKATLTADLCVSVMFSMPGGELSNYDCHAAAENELEPAYAARLLEIDRDVWSVETFWGRLRKDQIIDECRPCLGDEWAKGAEKLKKGELAADAAKRMRLHPQWLPKGFHAAAHPERAGADVDAG